MNFKIAPEARQIAVPIMEEHHPHLLGVRVCFLFMDKTPKSKGKEVWGRAKKISGLPAFLALGPETLPGFYLDQPLDFFVIEISEEIWEGLTTKGRKALVDHELSHLEIVEDESEDGIVSVNLAVVGHDVAEFSAVLMRHGLWNESVEHFVGVGAEQLSLDDAAAPKAEPSGGDGEKSGDSRVSQIANAAVERFREDHAEEIERGEAGAWVGSKS